MNTIAKMHRMTPSPNMAGTASVRTRLRDLNGEVQLLNRAPDSANNGVAHTMCCTDHQQVNQINQAAERALLHELDKRETENRAQCSKPQKLDRERLSQLRFLRTHSKDRIIV